MEPSPAKKVSESALNYCPRLIFPDDINPMGTTFGGFIMAEMDKAAAIVAAEHSRSICTTVQADGIIFSEPAYLGELLIMMASANRAWTSSMEIGVKVFARNPMKNTTRVVTRGYLTFVRLGPDGKPAPLPQIVPETVEEKRRFEEADIRRQARLTMKKLLEEKKKAIQNSPI